MGQNRDRVLEFHDKSSGVFEVIAERAREQYRVTHVYCLSN